MELKCERPVAEVPPVVVTITLTEDEAVALQAELAYSPHTTMKGKINYALWEQLTYNCIIEG